MTNYPVVPDDDTSLPAINDNLTQIGGDVINALRDSVVALEQTVGYGIGSAGPAGTQVSLAARMGVSIDPDGHILPSAIVTLGLVPPPFYDVHIAPAAAISESKLLLDYRTQDLFNYIRDLSRDVNLSLGWISSTGSKLDPHLIGLIYRHDLLQIDVIGNSALYLNSVFRVNRDNTDAYTLISGINNELLNHQWADGSALSNTQNIITNSGATYPSNFAHIASGVYVDTSGFVVIPQTDNNVQSVFNYFDANSIFLLGTRIQNLYHNGISANSRSSSLTADGYGQSLVPFTPAIAYLRDQGNQTSPIDNFVVGDDIIEFKPASSLTSNFSFDEQFLQTRVGDIVRVDYSADGYKVVIPYIISEIKYIPGSGMTPSTYMVRIAGKNIAYSPHAIARIDRTLFNNNKYGVLASANVDTVGITSAVSNPVMPSLIIGSPRGAQCLGVDFSPEEFNEKHFNLYLVLYPDGNPLHGSVTLPAIDVTGNEGITPGLYTLKSIVDATNAAFRAPGFNYRFIAFSYEGQFGIMLADSYNNASFSVVSAAITSGGAYDQTATQSAYPNNVVDVFTSSDALGFGPSAANLASPPFQSSFTTSAAAQMVTQIFVPLRRNNYYVNGAELERMTLDVAQTVDGYGDGYWIATIDGYPVLNAGPPGHTTVTYQVLQDLSTSGLKSGKTIVVQPLNGGASSGGVDYGRFTIQDVTFSACSLPGTTVQTLITVYDAVHASGVSPYVTAGPGTKVAIYFSSDSVSFDSETATDFSAPTPSVPFKRFFEVYVDDNEKTFTHERARFSTTLQTVVNGVTLWDSSPSLGIMDLLSVSPKLRGYSFGPVTKITIKFNNYDSTSGIYDGYLCTTSNGLNFTNLGPDTTGKIGEITRFYDASNVDYIDIRFPVSTSFTSFTNEYFDIQLFPTMRLDEEVMLVSSCQVSNISQIVNQIADNREFGNISEEELSTSAKNYISLPEKLLHFNGVVRGFDIVNVNHEIISIDGGAALVNGNITNVNQQIIAVPKIQELYLAITYPIFFVLCINSKNELVLLPVTDSGSPGLPTANRVMTVTNEVSLNTYQIDSDTFSNILNNRKELTPLYFIQSVVTGTGGSATVSVNAFDIRRYVNDADSSLPAVVTSGNAQGNFRTLSAAVIWLHANNSFQNQLQIKGTFDATGSPLAGISKLNIFGASGNAAINFTSGAFISGVTFNNLTINVSTTLNINVAGGPISGPVVFNNCIINITVSNAFVVGSNVSFNNCVFNYNYDATSNSNTGGAYVPADLVNAAAGMIYANIGVGGLLQDIDIRGCTFYNTAFDHFTFISLQLSDYSALAENINISDNNFINQASPLGHAGEDIRAVIAITSTLSSTTSGVYPLYPKIVDLVIENNVCNQDQMIVITGTPNSSTSVMSGASITAINSRISNNVCGAIGYFTSVNDAASSGNVAAALIVRDKNDNLVISGNTCHLITNLNNSGTYIPFYSVIPYVTVPTGQVDIIGNNANWISVGALSNNSSLGHGVRLINNKLNPSNSSYLLQYTNPIIQAAGNGGDIGNWGIYLAPDNTPVGTSQSVISGNSITQNTQYNSSGIAQGPYYYTNAIAADNNAQLINNYIDGVVSGTSIISVSPNSATAVVLVSGNVVKRSGLSISSYISGDSTSTMTIIGNSFDSATIDGSNSSSQITGTTSNTIILENTNQSTTDLIANSITFNAAAISPELSQASTSGTTRSLTIASQSTSGSHPGGNINIEAGSSPLVNGSIVMKTGAIEALNISGFAPGVIGAYPFGPTGAPTPVGGSIWKVTNWSGTNSGQIGSYGISGWWAYVPAGGPDVAIGPFGYNFPSSSMAFIEIEWVRRDPAMTHCKSQKTAGIIVCDAAGTITGASGFINAYSTGTLFDDVAVALSFTTGTNNLIIKAVHDVTYNYYWQVIVKINQI